MTEYRLHWWRSGTQAAPAPSVSLDAESPFHGAALALRQFMQAAFVHREDLAALIP